MWSARIERNTHIFNGKAQAFDISLNMSFSQRYLGVNYPNFFILIALILFFQLEKSFANPLDWNLSTNLFLIKKIKKVEHSREKMVTKEGGGGMIMRFFHKKQEFEMEVCKINY